MIKRALCKQVYQSVKKLALVSAISLLVTGVNIKTDFTVDFILKKPIANTKVSTPTAEAFLPLKRVPYIHHLVRFKKDQAKIQVLLNSDSEVNVMTSAYAAKLDLKV